MSEASKLQTIDFEARSHQILSQEPLLSARDVEVTFSLRGNKLTAIRRTSLDLYEGETLAIVGESGSGKSVFTKCFVGMLDKNGSITNGSIMYQGEDLAQLFKGPRRQAGSAAHPGGRGHPRPGTPLQAVSP